MERLAAGFQSGFAQQPDGEKTGVAHLRTNNVSEDGRVDLTLVKRVAATDQQRRRYALRRGDILFNNTNSSALVGKTALFDKEGEYLFSNHMTRIRFRLKLVEPKYIASFLHWSWRQGLFRSLVTQWVNQAAINQRQLGTVEIPLPPLSEQRRIVEVLDQADALRRLRAGAAAKAQRILPALFLKMFGDPATNPKNLRRERLGNLIKVRSGQFLPASAMHSNGTCPVYGGNGIAGYHSLHMFEDRKIVLGRVGVYCGVVHYTLPRSWVTDNALFVSQMSDDLRDRYLVEALRHLNLNQYAGRAGQPLISAGRIYPIEILVPTPREQDHFSSLATEAENLLLQQQVSSSELRALHDSVTYRAFSGELTAKWREAHREQLRAEMAEQAKLLNLSVPETAKAYG